MASVRDPSVILPRRQRDRDGVSGGSDAMQGGLRAASLQADPRSGFVAAARLRREARPPAGVEVFLVALDDDATPLDRLETLATPQERERALRYRAARDRRRYLARHAHLRRLVGERLACAPDAVRFAYGPYGKPMLEGAPLGVSLSRSHGLALIVLGDRLEVGCDIERVDPDLSWRDAADADMLAPGEAARLASLPEPQARASFFEMWTLKEAALKCLGQGLSTPARSVVTVGGEDLGEEGGLSAAVLHPTPAFAAAVAWAPVASRG